MDFKLHSPYMPTGDQPAAIEKLAAGFAAGAKAQVLLGVTGSGKTFTMANVIARLNRPTLVIAHNKVLASQLCNEFREFFPENRVEFFVSYYDYYQPEAYIPQSDTYIDKDMAINDEIDKLRNSATCSLHERRDTIVVASVSCIYGLGAPEEYYRLVISVRPGDGISRDALVQRLIKINYRRNDMEFARTNFRVRGDVLEVFPASSSEQAIRIEFFGDTVERICTIEALTGKVQAVLKHVAIYPATQYAVGEDTMRNAFARIEDDLAEQIGFFEAQGKLIEAQRIRERVNYDLEMLRELGYCTGVENYSRYFDGRSPGDPPYTLIDYFPKDFLCFVDESHMSFPQIRAMYHGDRMRKTNLVDYGFRLPAAYDNRPLMFDEFQARIGQVLAVSATPAPYELSIADNVVEQLIRPTGLVDPAVEVRPVTGQIDDLIGEIRLVTEKEGRTLVTTLTKKTAESLTDYLREHGIRVRYMHSDIDTLERIEIIGGLRRGDFDVLVGINLLREGLDLPEVRLVAILDADKEGFLRSESALIQTIGRAARNADGRVVLYADNMTGSMQRALGETDRRREKQTAYNLAHNITPKTIVKDVINTLEISQRNAVPDTPVADIPREIERLRVMMGIVSKNLDFEQAILIREEIGRLRKKQMMTRK